MKRGFFISSIILVLTVLSGCVEKFTQNLNEMDPDLLNNGAEGAWWDTNTIYYFYEDGSDSLRYSKRHLRTGQGTDILNTDSVWGYMQLDQERKHITFKVLGFQDKQGQLFNDTVINSTTWTYSVEDTFLRYESNTTIGTLTPKP